MPTLFVDVASPQFSASWTAPDPNPDDALSTRLHDAWLAAAAALNGLGPRLAAIAMDENLSPAGKNKAREAVSSSFMSRLDGPTAAQAAGEAEITRLSTQLESEGRQQINDSIKLPRALFLCEWFGRLDQAGQTRAIEEAIHSRDKETLGAILTAPGTWLSQIAPWFSLQQRGRVEDAFQTQSNPLIVVRRDGLKAAVQCLDFAIEQVGTRIRSECGLAAPDPDAAMRSRLYGESQQVPGVM